MRWRVFVPAKRATSGFHWLEYLQPESELITSNQLPVVSVWSLNRDGTTGARFLSRLEPFVYFTTCSTQLGSGQTPGELLTPLVLNSILSKALQYSLHGDTHLAGNFTFALRFFPETFHPHAPDSLNCLELRYKVRQCTGVCTRVCARLSSTGSFNTITYRIQMLWNVLWPTPLVERRRFMGAGIVWMVWFCDKAAHFSQHVFIAFSHLLSHLCTLCSLGRLCLFLRVVSQVDWPLNIIITDSCMNKYNRLFSFLLQLKHMVWSLREVWFHLKRTGERSFPPLVFWP